MHGWNVTLFLLEVVQLSLLVPLSMPFLLLVRFGFPPFLTYWFTRSLLLERTWEWLVARRDWLPTKPEKFYNTLFNSSKRYGCLGVCLGAIFRRDIEEAGIFCV